MHFNGNEHLWKECKKLPEQKLNSLWRPNNIAALRKRSKHVSWITVILEYLVWLSKCLPFQCISTRWSNIKRQKKSCYCCHRVTENWINVIKQWASIDCNAFPGLIGGLTLRYYNELPTQEENWSSSRKCCHVEMENHKNRNEGWLTSQKTPQSNRRHVKWYSRIEVWDMLRREKIKV